MQPVSWAESHSVVTQVGAQFTDLSETEKRLVPQLGVMTFLLLRWMAGINITLLHYIYDYIYDYIWKGRGVIILKSFDTKMLQSSTFSDHHLRVLEVD